MTSLVSRHSLLTHTHRMFTIYSDHLTILGSAYRDIMRLFLGCLPFPTLALPFFHQTQNFFDTHYILDRRVFLPRTTIDIGKLGIPSALP
jgi:hypothetical protein